MNAVMTPILRYWQGRTTREQFLLAVTGGLLLVLLVSVLIVQPLLRMNERARDDYAAAMRLYRSIQADARAYRELAADTSAGEQSTQSLRSVVGSLALRHEISLARMVPTEDGALTVNIDRAPTRSVMRWLIDLDERHGIQVMASTMDREGEGIVSASFVLRRRGGV
ncbi:type II secretion system protein M [Maricaulis sp.]|uniref:type II secretion system protein M n=1 Tax=Maricaulis sp. TaxID=1486257 RepID=UPI002631FDA4|nr:type II secretion system protein M [Maricaulis sp.]